MSKPVSCFVAAAGVAAGQQVSAQLKISAQGRRPAPPAAAAQLKMFWWTLNVQRKHILWLRRLFFSPPFLGGDQKKCTSAKQVPLLQTKQLSALVARWIVGKRWERSTVSVMSRRRYFTQQAGMSPKRSTRSAACTLSPSLRSNYPNNSKTNELTVIYRFANGSSATFSAG